MEAKKDEIHLPYKFEPRDYQLPVLRALDNGFKRIVWVAHRRSGKDKTFINHTAKAMYQRVGAYYYIFPTYKQAKKVIWNGMDRAGFKFMDHIPREIRKRTDNTDMLVETLNGSIFQLIGSDKIDSLMGANPVGCVFSEWPLQNPAAWDYLRPILAENSGWAAFIYTPRGKNHGYNTLELARAFPDLWFSQVLTVEDTKAIPEDVLAQERVEIIKKDGNDSLYQQEYMCFPKGTSISTFRELKDISEVRVNDRILTHTGRYRNVKKVFARRYEGELVVINSYGDNKPIKLTPRHPVRVLNPTTQTYGWKQSKEIKKNDFLVLPRRKIGKPVISSYLAILIAWYITEGSCGKNFVSFALNKNEIDCVDEIIKCLKEFGCGYQKRTDGTTLVVLGNSCYLSDFLANNCGSGASNKVIPFDLISGHERLVYDTLMKGDGCIAKTKVETWDSYATISESLAYGVQLLASSLGYRAGVGRRKNSQIIMGRKCNVQDSFSVQIRKYKPKKRGFLRIRPAKYGVGVKVRSVSREDYNGTVYNLGVQFDESYVANGRVVHNCSFDVPIQGAYYAAQLMAADDEGRISGVPYDPSSSVYTFWDLGIDDSMSIWFLQAVGQELHLIDYYENTGEGINFYIKILKEKPYVYGKHYAPHDIKARELTTGRSRLETAKKLGIDFEVVAKLSIDDGIDAVRMILNRCWFDKVKCEKGLSGLRSYHKEWDEDNQVFKAKPKHDWASHPADAFRTLAVGFQKEIEIESAVEIEVNVDPY